MEETKKAYGGCLSILLPLWIIGQILSMVVNFAYLGLYRDNLIIPALLIGINVVALIGIVLLLSFKKIGFYIFMIAIITYIALGIASPDIVNMSSTIRSIIGMCLFLILMGIKNKETKKNGYQTLGLFVDQEKTDNDETSIDTSNEEDEVDEATNENSFVSEIESVNDQIAEPDVISGIESENDSTSEPDNASVIEPEKYSEIEETNLEPNKLRTPTETVVSSHEELEMNQNDVKSTSSKTVRVSKKKPNKFVVFSALGMIIIILGLFFSFHDWRSNEQIFEEGKKYVEEEQVGKAVKVLERIQKNYTPAKALLGDLYLNNDSVKNVNRGEELLNEAVELNDTTACITLMNWLASKGELKKLKEISEKLIELGCWRGNRGLIALYWYNEIGGVDNQLVNAKKAEYYALKIADFDSWACLVLGEVYFVGGDGVEQDFSKTFYWWRKGSKLGGNGCQDCSYNLGCLYYNGQGINQNDKKAYESFKKAIEQDETYASAYYMLSVMFRKGLYVKANMDSTRFYLQKAAELGDQEATVELENEF